MRRMSALRDYAGTVHSDRLGELKERLDNNRNWFFGPRALAFFLFLLDWCTVYPKGWLKGVEGSMEGPHLGGKTAFPLATRTSVMLVALLKILRVLL